MTSELSDRKWKRETRRAVLEKLTDLLREYDRQAAAAAAAAGELEECAYADVRGLLETLGVQLYEARAAADDEAPLPLAIALTRLAALAVAGASEMTLWPFADQGDETETGK